MNQNLESELSLGEFEGIVGTFLENPCLETAQNANIASIKSQPVSPEDAGDYNRLIRTCLKGFRAMTPGLNGEKRHVNSYYLQMGGRLIPIDRMYLDED